VSLPTSVYGLLMLMRGRGGRMGENEVREAFPNEVDICLDPKRHLIARVPVAGSGGFDSLRIVKLTDEGKAELALFLLKSAPTITPIPGPAPSVTGLREQLPPDGTSYADENDVPAEFRDGGKPDGAVLTGPYLETSTNWLLLGPYLSRNYGREPGKVLTIRIRVGRMRAYLYRELLILRDHKTANEDKRPRRR
jgi:hypothetical protein